jgi:hypothetical protein
MELFKELKNKKATRRGRQQTVDKLEDIPRLHPQRLPIASAKKNDLMDLCRMGIIPPRYATTIMYIHVLTFILSEYK